MPCKFTQLRSLLLCLAVLILAHSAPIVAQEPPSEILWNEEYIRLYRKILAEEGEPEGGPKQLGPYLHWMDVKARDRDQVRDLYEKALDLSNLNAGWQEITEWAKKFQWLLDYVQESGNFTARMGATMLLRIDYRFGGNQWPDAIFKMKNDGHQLYNKALETRFDPEYIREYARCLANYAIKDVEVGHLGLYDGRESVFGTLDPEGYLVMPNRDFVTDCERRIEFTTLDKGDAVAPADEGLAFVEQIREECRWWNFGREEADATMLMEEFYRDQLCKKPAKGHKWYRELARQYHLQDSIVYNEGFYGTLYGTVQIETERGSRPAENARVVLTAPRDGEAWETITNVDGEYEIERALLHKTCSPFRISAEYERDREVDSFEGPLEEPDTTHRHRHDLMIHRGDLIAEITASIEWEDSSSRSYEITGSSEFSIRGKMLIESGGGTAVVTRYVPSNLELVTSYEEQWNRASPADDCPALYTRVQGGDTQRLAADGLNSMSVYYQAGPMSGVYEVMLLGMPPTEVEGKKQLSSSCMQPDCLCRRYEKYDRQVTIGRVGLRVQTDAGGEMTGSRTWESHQCAMKDMVGFSVNEAFGMSELDPSTEGGDEDCTVRISASWSFRPIVRRPAAEPPN